MAFGQPRMRYTVILVIVFIVGSVGAVQFDPAWCKLSSSLVAVLSGLALFIKYGVAIIAWLWSCLIHTMQEGKVTTVDDSSLQLEDAPLILAHPRLTIRRLQHRTAYLEKSLAGSRGPSGTGLAAAAMFGALEQVYLLYAEGGTYERVLKYWGPPGNCHDSRGDES